MKVIEALSKSLRGAAQYNASAQAAPAAILWPDKEREWLPVLGQLQAVLPELFCLGDYAPERRQGPAVWLKCVIAGTLPEIVLPEGVTPILYLPGVSRQDLRAIASCPIELQPLAELQYRGTLWSQVNARDWTANAFLVTAKGGLALDVAQDAKTQQALLRALEAILDCEISQLQGRRLEASDFNQLLTTDPVRDLLTWLSNAKVVQGDWVGPRWEAFCGVCQSEFGFHPERDGELVAAERLCARQGAWAKVWQRFVENPLPYARLAKVLALVQPDLAADVEGYPSVNQQDEERLESDLQAGCTMAPAALRKHLLALDEQHGLRRTWIWAELGMAPLAQLLEPLAQIAHLAGSPLSGATVEEMARHYREQYWQVDDAALRALAQAREVKIQTLVQSLLDILYTPWLHETALNFQDLVRNQGYPGSQGVNEAVSGYQASGEVVFFVDGLRFDIAQRLLQRLQSFGEVRQTFNWSALPSVTATAKAAVMPIHAQVTGRSSDADFQPSLLTEDKPLSSHYARKLMEEAGWQVLDASETGGPAGKAWVQTGDIDGEGHARQVKLASRIDVLLDEVAARVEELLQAGWRKIRLVTDHGWLLTPRPMSKVELAKHQTDSRWARCAEIKENGQVGLPTVNWHWSPEVTIAVPPGASAFQAGNHYGHGGLSLQECLTPVIEVINTRPPQKALVKVRITKLRWLGLTCKVEIESEASGLSADLRTSPADADSSIVRAKPLKDGKCSLMVADEDLQGSAAVLVVIDEAGTVLAKQATVVGEDA